MTNMRVVDVLLKNMLYAMLRKFAAELDTMAIFQTANPRTPPHTHTRKACTSHKIQYSSHAHHSVPSSLAVAVQPSNRTRRTHIPRAFASGGPVQGESARARGAGSARAPANRARATSPVRDRCGSHDAQRRCLGGVPLLPILTRRVLRYTPT